MTNYAIDTYFILRYGKPTFMGIFEQYYYTNVLDIVIIDATDNQRFIFRKNPSTSHHSHIGDIGYENGIFYFILYSYNIYAHDWQWTHGRLIGVPEYVYDTVSKIFKNVVECKDKTLFQQQVPIP